MVVLVGPTASGKTALGISIARALGGEILSADSQQIYRGFDLGTAKPSAAERGLASHHLIDLVEPTETFSAGAFARAADEEIARLNARKILPIVVGGTGLWVRALLLGIIDLPSGDAALRKSLEEEAREKGAEALHARLAAIDPVTAAATPAANVVRVMRALEIHAVSGRRPSELRAEHAFARLRYRATVLGLNPFRPELYRRIDARTRAMFEGGLLDEVRRHVAAGLRDAPAMRAIGYREALAVVDGTLSQEDAVARTAQASRHYAKRQLTWFRADPLVEWLPWPVDEAALISRLSSERRRG